MKIVINIDRQELEHFCKTNNIEKLSLFGSVLREDFNDRSDVDVLVRFKEGHVPGFFRLVEMEEELSGILGGHKADIRTSEDLSRYFRKEVVENSLVQYDAG